MATDPCETTPRKFLAELDRKDEDVFKKKDGDGPFVRHLKFFLGLAIWNFFGDKYIKCRMHFKVGLDSKMTEATVKAHRCAFIESLFMLYSILLFMFYILAWSICLFCKELLAYNFCLTRNDLFNPLISFVISLVTDLLNPFLYVFLNMLTQLCNPSLWLIIVTTIAVWRIVGTLAGTFRLHVLESHEPNDTPHALTMTFLCYVHVLQSFGILYLAEAYWFKDDFKTGGQLWDNFIDVLYFSAVTITTLGYGDLSPKIWVGKSLVILELFVGLILIVVTVQRALAGPKYEGK